MICPKCDGTGIVEGVDRNGFFEIDCPFCFDSLGDVDENELDADSEYKKHAVILQKIREEFNKKGKKNESKQ